MKKNIVLLLVFLILGGVTAYIVLNKSKTTLNTELKDFAVKDTSAITKIFLADRNSNSVTIEKINGTWKLNKESDIKKDYLKVMFDCLYKIEVRSPVAKAAYNNVIKALASSATKCEVYLNGEAKPFKTFYVGNQTEDEFGTFMMIENSSMPFITHIPGFNGYLTPRFSAKSESWKSLALFNYSPDDISSIMINYMNVPEKSFLISKNSGRYIIQNPTTNKFIQHTDSISIQNYIAQYRAINYENWLVEMKKEKKDSMIATQPSVRISIRNMKGKIKELDIYPLPVNKSSLSKFDDKGNPLKYDLDRVYGYIKPDKEMVTIQHQMIDKLLVQFEDFDANNQRYQKKH